MVIVATRGGGATKKSSISPDKAVKSRGKREKPENKTKSSSPEKGKMKKGDDNTSSPPSKKKKAVVNGLGSNVVKKSAAVTAKNRSSVTVKTSKTASSSTNNHITASKATAKASTTNSSTSSGPLSLKSPTSNKNIRVENMIGGLGPRIQAQRKFAQAGNIYSGTLFSNNGSTDLISVNNGTPLKRSVESNGHGSSSKKVKKPTFSPPPSKRPRTEDFLTFLCVRGTPSLPPELDFFNFPQAFDTEPCLPLKKKMVTNTASQSSSTNSIDTRGDLKPIVDTDSQIPNGRNKIVSKIQCQNRPQNIAKRATPEKKPSGSTTISSRNSISPTCKAENPTKGIRATASSVILQKLKTGVTKTRPIISPPRSRINEQDARFAMTALKLKYQRLAVNKSCRSALLAKKAKENIITRSKGKMSYSPSKKPKIFSRSKPSVISPSRNAPSPDIIFGVTSCAARKTASVSASSDDESSEKESGTESDEKEDKKPVKKSASKSTPSSSEGSQQSEDEGNDSDEASENEKESLKKSKETIRSSKGISISRPLRNGKELTKSSSSQSSRDDKSKTTKRDKSPEDRRVGTRAAHRLSKSPLREIPMWKPKKIKMKKLTRKQQKKGKEEKKTPADKKKKSETERSHSPAKKADDGKRPTRKTKETATNLLGLMTKGFSTDEEESDEEGGKDRKKDDSDVGSSSSSETNYLEKHYNAALRREEEKFLNKHDRKPNVSTRSRKSSGSEQVEKNSQKKRSDDSKKQGRRLRSTKPPSHSESEEEESSTKKSNKKGSERKKESRHSSPATRTRRRQSTPTVGNQRMPGAARKSAAITCSRKSHYSSSSDEDEHSSTESDAEKEDIAKSSGEKIKGKKSRPVNPKESKKDLKPSTKSASKKIISKKKSVRKDQTDEEKSASSDDASEETDNSDNPADEDDEQPESAASDGDVKPDVKPLKSLKTMKKKTSKHGVKLEPSSSEEDSEKSEGEPSKHLNARSQSKTSRSNSVASPISDDKKVRSTSEEEIDTSSNDEEDTPDKVDICIQCDMDEEDGIAPTVSSPSLLCEPKVEIPQNDSDDDVQEIGQVFASSSSSRRSSATGSQQSGRRFSTGSGASFDQTSQSRYPGSFHNQHSSHQQPQPTSSYQHQSIPTVDPNAYNPFMPPNLRPTATIQPEFYTPLQLAPPLVHSSIQLMGGTLGVGGPAYPMVNPLNTLSIPVSVPFNTHLLQPPPPIGFATGSTFHATTLQTHVRSISTNLSVPLVRPMVDTSVNYMTNAGRGPGIGLSSSTPLTRPPSMGMGVGMNGIWGQPQVDTTTRSHYSAFRVPHLGATSTHHTTHTHTQHVIHHQSTTVLGMNSTPVLPVSIIHPQTHHHPQHQQFQTAMPTSMSSQSQPQPSQQKNAGNDKRKSEKPSSTSRHIRPKQSHSTEPGTGPEASSSSTTAAPKRSPTPPGYHLIKHLPNVSIVPKFDRNAHAAGEQGPSGSKKKSDSKKQDLEPKEKKKVGRKPKESTVLPKPSSPLTVKKDSNPATYAPKKTKSEVKDEKKAGKKSKEAATTSDASSKKSAGKMGDKEKASSSSQSNSSNGGSSTINNPTRKREMTASPMSSKARKEKNSGKSSGASPSPKPPSRTSSPNVQKSKAGGSKGTPNVTDSSSKFSRNGIEEAPTFHPTESEFEEPLKYIQKVQSLAEKYGMARIVPPKSFRPECNVEDDMRFTAYNHYVHKMFQRWGPNVSESEAIKQHLKQNQVDISEVPMIGGMEINLSTLYQTVKSFGGLKEVIEKQKWIKVADSMYVPKAAHDRASKLDVIYCKYVLPYEILSDAEREKLKKKVEKKWTKRIEKKLKALENSDEEDDEEDSMDELDECIVKGKSTPLSSYFRVARNTMTTFFPSEKSYSPDEIEDEYWKIVKERNRPACVYSGSIDGVGWGFPIPKAANKHPWNLKALANNQSSVLRSMGNVMGATVPTLHVAMLFTSYCWYRDPHSLPWVEYLHSGAQKIWYSVASVHENAFRSVLTDLMPMQCKRKKIWLPSDSAMVPLDILISKGVPVVRAVQNPGEFLVVFPKAYTSAICTGYLISESVYFAYPSWLKSCVETFKDIVESKEPPVFPLEKLLLCILQDARASLDVVRMILPSTQSLIKEETSLRKKLTSLGIKFGGQITSGSEGKSPSKTSTRKKASREEEMEQCFNCNYTLYLSMVKNSKTDSVMCLKHAVDYFNKRKSEIKKSTLLFDFDEAQLESIVENATKRCGTGK